jgi:hypothetical protein
MRPATSKNHLQVSKHAKPTHYIDSQKSLLGVLTSSHSRLANIEHHRLTRVAVTVAGFEMEMFGIEREAGRRRRPSKESMRVCSGTRRQACRVSLRAAPRAQPPPGPSFVAE